MGRVEIDRIAYSRSLEGKSRTWILRELVANIFDQKNVTAASVLIEKVPNKHQIRLIAEDNDPNGFNRLSDIFTLWAESEKVNDFEVAGRFNEGEKKIILFAEFAEVITTKGGFRFEDDERIPLRERTQLGSKVTVVFKATNEDLEELIQHAQLLLPPARMVLTVNGQKIDHRTPAKIFQETLLTVHGPDLKPTRRLTDVHVYEVPEGETAMLYECGIPVVETDDTYHVNVSQKLPLNRDRDNVNPTYLKTLRAFVLNQMHAQIPSEDFTKPWVSQAVQDKHVTTEAVGGYLTAKYGEKRATFDAANPESNSRLLAEGYVLIYPKQESKDTWGKIRQGGLSMPSGQLMPTRVETVKNHIPQPGWSDGMRNIAAYCENLSETLIGRRIRVDFVNDINCSFRACFGQGLLIFNVGRLGYAWFMNGPTNDVNALYIHELGHSVESDHLSGNFHRALCDIGAKLASAVARDPNLFKKYGRNDL